MPLVLDETIGLTESPYSLFTKSVRMDVYIFLQSKINLLIFFLIVPIRSLGQYI